MRTIKFRFFNNLDKAIVTKELNEIMIFPKNYWTDEFLKGEIIIDQFTGFEDINQIEIYEGDILKKSNGDVGLASFCEVFGRFDFLYDDNYFHNIPLSQIITHSKVIGNIHQNPELLK